MKVVAFERKEQGTGASRRLRNAGKTTGIVYGGEAAPQMIELDHNALWHALKKEAFHSSILDLEVAGQSQQVLLRDVQYHPFKQLVLHVDFQRVDAKKKLHTKVPLHFLNAEVSPAVKLSSAIVSHVATEIEVECLPAALPEFLEVDLSKIEAGQSIHAKDIALPKGVALTAHVDAENPVIASATIPAGAVSDAAEGETPAA
ncbi:MULTISPECIES: 50S ribosomal protein L25/general stress protein Ctc [Burkholderia]|jgi:large subunit ribosomal protein L25|uniref:Large ribosomal subunit protein bL25 n=3 Tax=Burkholderia multivorans TaxID=87883 RepID=RL25_BURM1|nr:MULTISPECIES: 50S ribosomal protein L25/general stress protein Ctc [Burkholderia]A9AEY7.1 RecName: Full=Large ribosomal subunit protein bL25; AltName: Full=50S ribosomal protein L25; AltName: Full=General stress protein CTC [Burkholderia multivorans ATCC 17616]ABX14207.1 ribosomal 5S rRNA E-loop binding protein Ctc/L25/TL5 [Burkholderia multivorans ATCC 17616]AJY17715.1 ribosomal protein L25, Ctc-form [Burkholderia multivorans ATCC BAA-247]AOJ93995.1 50S ribosomal protein L25 [Burkholderia m